MLTPIKGVVWAKCHHAQELHRTYKMCEFHSVSVFNLRFFITEAMRFMCKTVYATESVVNTHCYFFNWMSQTAKNDQVQNRTSLTQENITKYRWTTTIFTTEISDLFDEQEINNIPQASTRYQTLRCLVNYDCDARAQTHSQLQVDSAAEMNNFHFFIAALQGHRSSNWQGAFTPGYWWTSGIADPRYGGPVPRRLPKKWVARYRLLNEKPEWTWINLQSGN